MTRQKNMRYPGQLGIKRPASPLLSQPYPDESEFQDSSDTVRTILAPFVDAIKLSHIERAKQDLAGLGLLLDHFGISSDDPRKWHWLALRLAEEHVPGFQYERSPKGRKRQWGIVEQQELISHVEGVMRDHPHFSANDACRHLVTRGIYETDSLSKRYSEAKKRLSE